MRLINSVGVLGSLLCCFYCVICVFVGCSFVILLFVCLFVLVFLCACRFDCSWMVDLFCLGGWIWLFALKVLVC